MKLVVILGELADANEARRLLQEIDVNVKIEPRVGAELVSSSDFPEHTGRYHLRISSRVSNAEARIRTALAESAVAIKRPPKKRKKGRRKR